MLCHTRVSDKVVASTVCTDTLTQENKICISNKKLCKKLLYSPDLKMVLIFLVTKVFQKGKMFHSLTSDSMSLNGRRQGFMVTQILLCLELKSKKRPWETWLRDSWLPPSQSPPLIKNLSVAAQLETPFGDSCSFLTLGIAFSKFI